MANWLTYFKERFPLPVYLVLVGGLALSGNVSARGDFEWKGFTLAFVGIMGFFALLRLMDEYKDFEKDKIVNPTRPLPRGILKPEAVSKAIGVSAIAMLVYSGVCFAVGTFESGLLYLVVTVWLWLMFKEFYLGQWLVDRPLLYAISHQLILLPLCGFAVVTHDGSRLDAVSTWLYGGCVLGAFFTYEICRKLDPDAHPLQKTYLHVYGAMKSLALVVVLNVIAGVCAYYLDLGLWLWLPEIATIFVVAWIAQWPERFKWAEGVATLSLTLHIWALAIAYYLNFRG